MSVCQRISHFCITSLAILVLAGTLVSTGCTVYSSGMTMPSAHYLKGRVQYHPKNVGYQFANEAAALQEAQVK